MRNYLTSEGHSVYQKTQMLALH